MLILIWAANIWTLLELTKINGQNFHYFLVFALLAQKVYIYLRFLKRHAELDSASPY